LAVREALQRYTCTTLGNPECASADLKGSLIPDVLRCGACSMLRRFRRSIPQHAAQSKTTQDNARYRTHVGTATQRNAPQRTASNVNEREVFLHDLTKHEPLTARGRKRCVVPTDNTEPTYTNRCCILSDTASSAHVSYAA